MRQCDKCARSCDKLHKMDPVPVTEAPKENKTSSCHRYGPLRCKECQLHIHKPVGSLISGIISMYNQVTTI